MKRIRICIVAMLMMLVICGFSLWRVYQIKEEALTLLQEIQLSLEDENRPQALSQTQELVDYWKDAQSTLIRYVHHVPVDEISNRIMGLPALCAYGEYGEFQAEIDRISHLLVHTWQSELPLLRNLI